MAVVHPGLSSVAPPVVVLEVFPAVVLEVFPEVVLVVGPGLDPGPVVVPQEVPGRHSLALCS